MAVADPQLIDMRHRRPAATGDDLVVGRDRLLGELLGRRRQHRRRSFRHMDGARGLVEILAELAGTAVAHERVERVVGEGAARNTAQCRRAGALRQKSGADQRLCGCGFRLACLMELSLGGSTWHPTDMPPKGPCPRSCPPPPFGLRPLWPANLWPTAPRDITKKDPGGDAGVLSYASTTENLADKADRLQPVENLIGPEPLEPMQRLVEH